MIPRIAFARSNRPTAVPVPQDAGASDTAGSAAVPPILRAFAAALLCLPLAAPVIAQDSAAALPAHAPAPAAQQESAAPRRPGETTTGRPPASARPETGTAGASAGTSPADAPAIAPLPGDGAIPGAATQSPDPAQPGMPAATPAPAATATPAPAPAQVRPPAPVAMPASSPGAGGLLQTIFALLLVLGLLAGLAWFMKRYGPKTMGSSANLRVVGALNIGGRERIMVVEVGDQWIVVGAAPGRVNALHTMPRQEGEAAIAPAAGATPGGNFADWLRKTIDHRGSAGGDHSIGKRNEN